MTPSIPDAAIAALERALALGGRASSLRDLLENPHVLAALGENGFIVHVDFVRVLAHGKPRSCCPNDVSVLQAVSYDRNLCAKLVGDELGDELLLLLAHTAIRTRVTRRFLLEFRDYNPSEDACLWSAAHALVAAIESELVKVSHLTSIAQFLKLAGIARQQLRSSAYQLPPPPFALPEGWTWFSTGADFADQDGSPGSLGTVELEHAAISVGHSFFLRDPTGACWHLHRNPYSNTPS